MKKNESLINRIVYSKLFFVCIMLTPMVLHLLIFWLGVQIESIEIAFVVDGTFSFSNFKSVIDNISAGTGSAAVIPLAIKNTLIFFTVGFATLPMHVFFAYMIHKKMFGYKFVRMALYMPTLIGSLMMAIMFQQLFMTDGPLINLLNNQLHLNIPTPILMEAPMYLINAFDIWIGVGSNIVIWIGAMGRIPYELVEAAELDGITPFKEFTKIVMPLIWPTFTTYVTLHIVGILGASGSVLVFTEGNYGTWTLSYWLYHVVYKGQSNQYGIASALGLMMTIVTLPLVYIGRKITNRFGGEVEY